MTILLHMGLKNLTSFEMFGRGTKNLGKRGVFMAYASYPVYVHQVQSVSIAWSLGKYEYDSIVSSQVQVFDTRSL